VNGCRLPADNRLDHSLILRSILDQLILLIDLTVPSVQPSLVANIVGGGQVSPNSTKVLIGNGTKVLAVRGFSRTMKSRLRESEVAQTDSSEPENRNLKTDWSEFAITPSLIRVLQRKGPTPDDWRHRAY